MDSNYFKLTVTAQIALYFVRAQGESAQFTSVNEHFQRRDQTK